MYSDINNIIYKYLMYIESDKYKKINNDIKKLEKTYYIYDNIAHIEYKTYNKGYYKLYMVRY